MCVPKLRSIESKPCQNEGDDDGREGAVCFDHGDDQIPERSPQPDRDESLSLAFVQIELAHDSEQKLEVLSPSIQINLPADVLLGQ